MSDLEFKTYTFNSGAVYTGTFKGTKRHGKGHWRHPEGEIYEGEYEENRQSGLGIYLYSNGKRYIGTWKNSAMSGDGVYYFSADLQTFYAGGYESDKKHGKGYYQYENGLMTVQEWDHGHMVSEVDATPQDRVKCARHVASVEAAVRAVAPKEMGPIPEIKEAKTFHFPSGSTYTGEYSGTKKFGKGHWSHPEGDTYSGEFEDNKHVGWGVYVTGRSGKKYVGQWKDGKMNGWGVYFFNPTETEFYVGQYKDDRKNGIGMYHFSESGHNKAQNWEQGLLKKEVDADPTTVSAYQEAIKVIIETVQSIAPQYKSSYLETHKQ